MIQKYAEFNNTSWIGVPACQYADRSWNGRLSIQTAYFRKVFKLESTDGAEAILHISAVTRYRLYVNGCGVVSGPCKGDYWRNYFETVDISKYLKQGKNIIAVKVVAYPPYEAQHQNGEGQGPMFSHNGAAGPCLVAGGIINIPGQEPISLNTGESDWSVCLDRGIEWETPHLSFWLGAMEIVHGALLPAKWNSAEEPKGQWSQSEIRWDTLYNKYGEIFPFPLKRRPIPLLYEKEICFSKEMPCKKNEFLTVSFDDETKTIYVPAHTKVQVELDVGWLTTAYIDTKIKGGKDGKIIFRYAESYANKDSRYEQYSEDFKKTGDAVVYLEKGERNDSLHYDFIGHEDVYYPSGNEESYQPFWFRTMRFLRIEIYTEQQELTLHLPQLNETGYPLPVHTTFSTSDTTLQEVWEISLRTLQRCMHETYEDCPYYEQMQYTMDTRLEMLFTYALGGDTRMAKRTIEDYHSSMLPEGILQSRFPTQAPQVIPMFCLHWIFMLEDYYEQTGDASIPRRYRPTVDAVLDWYERYTGDMGLVEHMDYWQQIDWVEEWDEYAGMPKACLYGPSSIHNLIYAYAMQIAAKLNRITGREECGREYEKRAAKILKIVDETCWDEKVGAYREGPSVDEYSQHAQVFAVLTGLAVGEKAKNILAAALELKDMRKCSFPMMFYFIRALEKVGMYGKVSGFIDTIKEFVALGTTTIPETPFRPRSECHAWGSFALYEFPRSILGVKMGETAWDKILIEPRFICANDCKGSVYTPKGTVEVAWEKKGAHIQLKGTAPSGVMSTIILPNGNRQVLQSGGAFFCEFEL